MGIRTMKIEKRKAVFLDRDGVLNLAMIKNGKPYPPCNLDELQIPEDVPPALQTLKNAGFLLIGITNQPDVVALLGSDQGNYLIFWLNDE